MNSEGNGLPLRRLLPITLGTACYAVGLHLFVIPNKLMEGGVTGVALLLNYALGLAPSLTTLALNIPLFVIGWRLIGRQAMLLTVYGTLSLSACLWLLELAIGERWITPYYSEDDLLLAALYAGVTLGGGLGLVFRYGGTTGGSDIIARIGYKRRGWSMGRIIFVFDAAVITVSLLYIPVEKVLYTLITVFIATRLIDFIEEGAYAAKAFTIITDHGDALAAEVVRALDRGVTVVPAYGGFSGHHKRMVYCVVGKTEARRLKALVRQIDPKAFMVISDVHDVLGEGFRGE